MKEFLKQQLRFAVMFRFFIPTRNIPRAIGKTTALVELAKELDYYVLVYNENIASDLRDKFEYSKIIGVSMCGLIPKGENILTDEIPPSAMEQAYRFLRNVNFVGGWVL